MTQRVEPKPCDICGERSTSLERNDQGEVRLCDKHYIERHGNNGFDWNLQKRREELRRRIALIIVEDRNELRAEDFKTAEKILQELNL